MVVDASIWVSGLVVQDVNHQASRRWLNQSLATTDPPIIPTLALAEVAGAIARRTGVPHLGQQAAEEILHAPGLRLVALDAALGTEAARLAATYQLRGADAVYVAVAHLLNVPLVTLDNEMPARAGGLIQIVQP
jgi:predicted nucleic acid-binding protein